MKKTLVTGATGYTGRNLCRRLVEEGRKVVAFVRQGPGVKELSAVGVECRRVDITDPLDVADNFSEVGRVFHLAAAYRTELGDPEEYRRVNVIATENLLKASMKNNVSRFVHCSTVGVQGEIDKVPAREDYRFAPGDHYQRSKMEGELLARKYFSRGLAGVVVRPVGIYGPGDTRFLKLFRPINRGYFVMIGAGKALYHMTYIDDLVEGFLLCGEKNGAVGEVFTLGGERYTTIRELVDLIADTLERPRPRMTVPFGPVYALSVVCERLFSALGKPSPLYPRRMDFFHKDRAFCIEKAGRILGYRPKVGLREGIERTAEAYRRKGEI